MSFSAKKFLQQYGTAGIISYVGVTLTSIVSIYAGLRSGVDIVLPLEKCLGSDSELVQNVKAKLGEAPTAPPGLDGNDGGNTSSINWVREGTYLGIAGALDSFVIPVKLMICLPLARQLLKIRGRRR
eukprot:jgi/Psemu1/252217/estExt_Genewise1Plus.C_420093